SHYDYKAKKMDQFRSNLSLEVTIDVKPTATTQDIVAAINRVFIRPEELAGRVPAYWREFLGGKQPDTDETAAPKAPAQQVSGNVMQAKLVKMVRPKYPEDARNYSFEGVVTF